MVDKKYTQYAEDVIAGNIVAGKLIILAAKRYMNWINGSEKDIEFIPSRVDRVVNFIAKLKHSTGRFYNKPFILQDWQFFCVSAIYGFYYRSNGKRVCRSAYILIARKCGKTSLASALALYALCADGEHNAEVDIVAPSSNQSQIGFRSASQYIQSINRNNIFKLLRKTIQFKARNSIMQIMSSDAKFGDGFNTSCGILDEFHAFDDNKIADLLTSSMVMRDNPLMIYITTAGFNLFSPCKEYRDMCVDILYGNKQDNSVFSAIYEMDEDDLKDWTNPKYWKKCIPSLGITVNYESVQDQITKATNNSSLEVGVKTKTLNIWCNSRFTWIRDEYIQKSSQNVDFDDFTDNDICYGGIDLASVSDLTSVSFLFPPNKNRKVYPDKYVFKTICYLPEESLYTSANSEKYKFWKSKGYLKTTPGNVADYDYILTDICNLMKTKYIYRIGYDTWNATQFAVDATTQGVPLYPYSQSLGSFNRPCKEFERLVLKGLVVIDNNPLVRWAFQNVELKTDWNENVKPVKSGDMVMNKIDPVISMLEALGIALDVGNADGTII